MLASPKADALVTNFAGQWLYLRNLAATSPDARTFPDFDDNLRQAFRRETELFVESIVKEDRSALDLLRANYTFVNERLAKHYGIPNVYGSRFRRVSLDEDSPRGGILGHGSVLTVTLVRQPDIASASRQMDPREHRRDAAAAPAAERAAAEGHRRRGTRALDARAHGPASREPRLRGLPSAHGSGRASRWRTSMRLAGGACRTRIGQRRRRIGRASRRLDVHRHEWSAHGAASQAGSVRRHAHREAPDLRAWAAASSTTTLPRCARSSATRATQDYRFSSLVLGIVSSDPFQMRMSQ